MKIKQINKMLSCVDDNKRLLGKICISLAVILVGILGYGLGVSNQASKSMRYALESSEKEAKQVLGDKIAPFYANPFDKARVKEIKFPIAQLLGCRNWEECSILCSKPANFQECVAWSNSQE